MTSLPSTSGPRCDDQPAGPDAGVEANAAEFTNAGYCACCRNQTVFIAQQAWLRDFYICSRCHSVPRQRHLQTVLDETVSGWHDLVIHESSPSNEFLAQWCSHYSASQFFVDVPRGEFRDGVRSENLEDLTLPDESVDLFITQDVFEHVFRPDLAVREIHRVLRPGGAHVFTTPKHRHLEKTLQRARLTDDGTEEHLLPAAYHGNPIGEKALVTFDWGQDFEELLSGWLGGAAVQTHHRLDRSRGLDAEHNEVYVIRKPPRAAEPESPEAAAPESAGLGGRVRSAGARLASGVRTRRP